MDTMVELAVRANADDLLNFFLRRLANPEEAADALGETLLVVWRKRRSLPQDSTAARMWMFGVAKNVLKHVERGNARRFRLASELRNVAALQTAGTQSDEAIDVRNAIACLSPKLAELIRLVHWDGFTLAEAATLQGIPASTARSRYAQARKILSARLRAMDSREDPLAPVLGVALTSVHEEGS